MRIHGLEKRGDSTSIPHFRGLSFRQIQSPKLLPTQRKCNYLLLVNTFFSAREEVCEALLVIVTTLVKLAGSRTLTPFKGTTTAFFLALICTGRNILQKPYTPLLKILSFKPLAIKWTSLILIKCTFVM